MKWSSEDMIEAIKNLSEKLGKESMPTSSEMVENGLSGLSRAISLRGGMELWRIKSGLQKHVPKSPIWSDELIEQELKKSIEILGLDRMPTANELKSIERNDLHCKVSRTLKYSGWADKLNLNMKDCDTRAGQNFEANLENILKSKGFSVQRMSTRYPFDLLVNGCVKIDAKVSNPYNYEGQTYHTFRLAKKYGSCDIYMCQTLLSEQPDRLFIIPSHYVQVVMLSVGKKSKYDKYIDRWDYIEQYSNFMKSLR